MADSLNTLSLPENRPALEALIEAAIARLDDIEPDPDLEPDEDGEPQLGAPEARTGTWNGLYPEAFTDTHEADDCDLEDGADIEAVCEDEGADEERNGYSTANYTGSCSPIRFAQAVQS